MGIFDDVKDGVKKAPKKAKETKSTKKKTATKKATRKKRVTKPKAKAEDIKTDILTPKKVPKVSKVISKRSANIDDLVKRIDITVLYPAFRVKLLRLVRACRGKESDFFVISGLRSWNEQTELYAQGRGKPGKVVTNAKPGRSAHNYGVAGDGCKDAKKNRKGLQPDWKLEEYVVWAKEAEALGLEAGMSWKSFKEGPHVQLPLRKHGLGWNGLQALYRAGGMERVWTELDKHNWDGPKCNCA